jgi:hypothetical protein
MDDQTEPPNALVGGDVLGPSGPADRPGGSGRVIGEVRFLDHGPPELLRAAQSMPTKLRLLFVKPSIQRETAVDEHPGRTFDRSNFV